MLHPFLPLFSLWATLSFSFVALNDHGPAHQRPILSAAAGVASALLLLYVLLGSPRVGLLPAHLQWAAPWDAGPAWFTAPLGTIDAQAKVWMWWAALVGMSLCNVLFLGYVMLTRRPQTAVDSAQRRLYAWRVKWLAVPFVVQCAFRSVFPEVYAGDCLVEAAGCTASRLVFFDHPLNGVLVCRALAAVGETCFAAQVALVVDRLNGTLPRARRSRIVAGTARLIVVLILAAEVCSYTCTATTVNLFCAAENSLWTVSVSLIALACMYLYWHSEAAQRRGKAKGKGAMMRRRHANRAGTFFVVGGVIGAAGYVPFMSLFDVPMYLERHRRDLAMGKTFFSFYDGMVDAWTRRDATQAYGVWKDEMVWRGVYFTAVVWVCVLLVHAPEWHFAEEEEGEKKKKTKTS